jgi:hypothetical protein
MAMATATGAGRWRRECVCVCVCVCERERERGEKGRVASPEREIEFPPGALGGLSKVESPGSVAKRRKVAVTGSRAKLRAGRCKTGTTVCSDPPRPRDACGPRRRPSADSGSHPRSMSRRTASRARRANGPLASDERTHAAMVVSLSEGGRRPASVRAREPKRLSMGHIVRPG